MMRGYVEAGFNAADIVSGAVGSGDYAPNSITSGAIGSGALMGQAGGGSFGIASGSLSTNDFGSGVILSGLLGSGIIGRFHVASGQLAGFELGSGAIVSGRIASGQIGRFHLASGNQVDIWPCGQDMSGALAVAFGSGGDFVVPAERGSGLRLPAFGVTVALVTSGNLVEVVTRGRVFVTYSGGFASGFPGRFLYVGSGGFLINQSGFMEGASSGHGVAPTAAGSGYSGALVQRIALSVSGGFYVMPETTPTSGLFSGQLGQY